MADWIPIEGDKLYLRIANRPMDLKIGDVYGKFSHMVYNTLRNGKVDKKYQVAIINGKTFDYSEEIFFKWFSKEPTIEVVKRVCKVKTDVDKTPKINRKR